MRPFAGLLVLIAVSACAPARAQLPFSGSEAIDINNISASMSHHGDLWWDPQSEAAHCFFPKASGKSIEFASALWLSGFDPSNKLHVSAEEFQLEGNDLWPGPLDGSDTVTYAESYAWAKIWKVNRTDIQYFQALSSRDITNVPLSILTWPGNGNTYATGNAGISLTITGDMAPFVDVNHNGIYEPLLGDYPDIKGDQALWCVFCDNGASHDWSGGLPLKAEVHLMAYAYNRGTLIDNVVYYDYTVINKSAQTYHNARLALFNDAGIGYPFNDFLGFDSTLRMDIGYNGTSNDGVDEGYPPNAYDSLLPVAGITMIVSPGDAGSSIVPAGSFMYFNNDFSAIGNPFVDTEFNNYMRSRFRFGQHLANDFVGPDTSSYGTGPGPYCNYVYGGDPADTTEWSECNSNHQTGDRRCVLATSDFTFAAGASAHLVLALVATGPGLMNGCPGITFDSIRIVADTAWKDYRTPLPELPPNAVSNVELSDGLRIFPNPAHDQLTLERLGANGPGAGSVQVFSGLGVSVPVPITVMGNKATIDVRTLPAGLYLVRYSDGVTSKMAQFVKE